MCVVNNRNHSKKNKKHSQFNLLHIHRVFFCLFLQNELVFKPSIGVEFVTKMAVNVPEFAESATEMHTSMYHESALQAKISMENNEVKLSIPAPEGTMRVFSMWYKIQFFIPALFITQLVCHKKKVFRCVI